MVEGYKILNSTYKHGISEQEIHYVLSDSNPTTRSYTIHDDKNGNAQDMFVAYTGTRPYPIEVGVCYKPKLNVVFHASKITQKFKALYEIEP